MLFENLRSQKSKISDPKQTVNYVLEVTKVYIVLYRFYHMNSIWIKHECTCTVCPCLLQGMTSENYINQGKVVVTFRPQST